MALDSHARRRSRTIELRETSDEGNSILQKAARLKKFVEQQKNKLGKSKALHEWMVAQQRLRDECCAAERDVAQAREDIAELLAGDRSQDAVPQEWIGEQTKSRELQAQALGLWQSIANRGLNKSGLSDELRPLKQELEREREELERQEAACTDTGPSVLSEESERDEGVTWQAQLEDLFAKFPNACDEAGKVEQRRFLTGLEASFSAKLSDLEATTPPSNHGGWSPEDHEAFLRVRRAGLGEMSGASQPHAEIVSRLCRMMPHRTQREVVQHIQWYAERVLWQQKLDDLRLSRARQLDEALEELESKLKKKEAAFHKAATSALESMQREAAQTILQTKLDNHRLTQVNNAHVDLQQRLVLAEVETENRVREERRLKEERAKVKELLARYHAEIEGLAKEKETEAAKGKALREEAARAEAKLNSERVNYRRREQIKKLEQLRRAAVASKKAEREKEERLAKLRAKVAVQVEADKARVLQPTAAMTAAENAARERELFPVHGFTSDELMKDKRFRLGIALREAGLHKTNAGREAMLTMGPKVVKRDTLSQIRLAPETLPR